MKNKNSIGFASKKYTFIKCLFAPSNCDYSSQFLKRIFSYSNALISNYLKPYFILNTRFVQMYNVPGLAHSKMYKRAHV